MKLDTQEISNPLWYPEVQVPNIEPTLHLISIKTFNSLQLNLVRNLASTQALPLVISQINIPLVLAAKISNSEKVDRLTEQTGSQGGRNVEHGGSIEHQKFWKTTWTCSSTSGGLILHTEEE